MVFIIFQHLYFEESVLPLLITYCTVIVMVILVMLFLCFTVKVVVKV